MTLDIAGLLGSNAAPRARVRVRRRQRRPRHGQRQRHLRPRMRNCPARSLDNAAGLTGADAAGNPRNLPHPIPRRGQSGVAGEREETLPRTATWRRSVINRDHGGTLDDSRRRRQPRIRVVYHPAHRPDLHSQHRDEVGQFRSEIGTARPPCTVDATWKGRTAA
jgi:hypothetical protein